ncbi:tetraketide alpha-pyrone reductase 1 [Tanacetum coccineum]
MAGGTVCVTGASGFLASWLIKRLLLSGYHVVGTVRDPGNDTKLAHLWNLEGRFDDAIKGCEGVFPWLLPYLDNLLIHREKLVPKTPLDESSWSSVELCSKLKIWYVLSKTMAEKAAWEFCNENGINLVTVSPSFVVGPSLPPTLCSTASDILSLLQDDVALCHILVYESEEAEGRYLCSLTVVDNDELVSILSARYPTLPIPKRFEQHERPYYDFNTNKIKSLGFTFKSIPEMFDDCITSLVAQGHLSIP